MVPTRAAVFAIASIFPSRSWPSQWLWRKPLLVLNSSFSR